MRIQNQILTDRYRQADTDTQAHRAPQPRIHIYDAHTYMFDMSLGIILHIFYAHTHMFDMLLGRISTRVVVTLCPFRHTYAYLFIYLCAYAYVCLLVCSRVHGAGS